MANELLNGNKWLTPSVLFFALYDRRLTDAECTWLYNSGSTREYTDL